MAAADQNRLIKGGRQNRSLELLEESLQVLRTGGAEVLLFHWTGSLPFAIALLWLLRDTNFRWAGPLLLRDSLLCAVAFLWMSFWKSVASRQTFLLLTTAAGDNAQWPARLLLQCCFQTIKLFVMPLAVASLVAWPAASAFFRTLSLEPLSKVRPLRSGLRRAFSAATHHYVENAVAFLTVAALSVVTFLNVLITLAFLPSLWKMLTGYETDWSRLENPGVIFSLFSVAAIATWFLIDPWLQTLSVLRVFYQNARSDGRDLLRDLSRLAAIVLISISFVSLSKAEQPKQPVQTLTHAIEQASKDVSYGWLRPAPKTAPQGFLGLLAKAVSDAYLSARDHLKTWARSFMNWLRDLFRDRKLTRDDLNNPKPRAQELRWMLALLAVLICGFIIALFLRTSKPRTSSTAATASASSSPDVSNEKLLPSDVNQEEWLRLAWQYVSENQTRLAARAFYLANLSYLGAERLLSLALWKSNRLYERELARQPKSSDLSAAFTTSNRLYERAWYGLRELSPEQMEILEGAVEQIRHRHA